MNKTTTNSKTSTTTIIKTCIIKATTWNEGAQDVDDENSQKFEQEFEVSSSTNVSRTSIGISMGEDVNIKDNTHYNLFNLCQENGVFTITKPSDGVEDVNFKSENLWKMLQSTNEEDSQSELTLNEGDILKLGKIKLRVRELKGFPEPVLADNMEQDDNIQKKKATQEFLKKCKVTPCFDNTDLICRICLENTQNEENPLVSPCSCTGTVNHIHLDCLRHWIKTKCRVNVTSGCTVYIWKDLDCELCHHSFPDMFAQGETMTELVELIKPTKTYMILETMPEMKKFKKIFYVAYMSDRKADKTFTIGRKIECQININDPSVSRLHSTVKYSNGKFTLKNRSATYGTLILLDDKHQLKKDQKLAIKVGRSILSFTAIEREVLLSNDFNEVPALEDTPVVPSNVGKIETDEEEKTSYDYHRLRKDSLLNTANLSFDFINSNSLSGVLPITTDILDQPEEDRLESQAVHINFEEMKIKDDLENLDRLSSKIKKILEECYKTLENSDKKTQDLNGNIVDNQHAREDVTTHQDDTLIL